MKISKVLIIIIVFCISFWIFSSSNHHNSKTVEKPIQVEVQKVKIQKVPYILNLSGNNEASEDISITSQVTGKLIKVNFKQGANVKKGDLLFQIDKRTFEFQLEQVQATLIRDQTLLSNAQKEERRYLNLLKEKAVSEEQYQQILTNYNSLKATVEADKAAINNAKLQIEYSNIYAPIDGKTGELLIDEGNIVESNNSRLVSIKRITPIYINFSVPDKHLSSILKAHSNSLLEANVMDSSDNIIQSGRIIFIDNQVNQQTGTIKLKASFENENELLWPGQSIKLSLKVFDKENAVTIPSQAIQINQDGPYVFVVDNENRISIRKIKIDFVNDDVSIISEGLAEGEIIVTNGQLRLTDKNLVSFSSIGK